MPLTTGAQSQPGCTAATPGAAGAPGQVGHAVDVAQPAPLLGRVQVLAGRLRVPESVAFSARHLEFTPDIYPILPNT